MGDDVMSCEIDIFGSMYIAGRDLFYKQCVLSTMECICFPLVTQDLIMRD